MSRRTKDLPHTAVTDDEYFEEVVKLDVSGVVERHDGKLGVVCRAGLRCALFIHEGFGCILPRSAVCPRGQVANER